MMFRIGIWITFPGAFSFGTGPIGVGLDLPFYQDTEDYQPTNIGESAGSGVPNIFNVTVKQYFVLYN